MIFLDLDDLLHIAQRVFDEPAAVRDAGLLQAALARPRATVGGRDAYPTIREKAAALLHSLSRNHALVDGNERLALASTIAFCGVNGFRLNMSNDAAYELVTAVVTGSDDVPTTARLLRTAVRPRLTRPVRKSAAS